MTVEINGIYELIIKLKFFTGRLLSLKFHEGKNHLIYLNFYQFSLRINMMINFA